MRRKRDGAPAETPAEQGAMTQDDGTLKTDAAEKDKGGETEKKAPAKKRRKKRTLGQALAMLLLKIGIVAGLVAFLVTVVGGVFICHTNDMFPALRDGDLVITFRLGTYHTGDIIAYGYGDETLFGRIVCEPGDVIYLDEEGTYTVNGTPPYETIFYETYPRESGPITYPYTVQEGEYFVMADAREEGLDSRALGPTTEPKGKVVLQLRRRGF